MYNLIQIFRNFSYIFSTRNERYGQSIENHKVHGFMGCTVRVILPMR